MHIRGRVPNTPLKQSVTPLTVVNHYNTPFALTTVFIAYRGHKVSCFYSLTLVVGCGINTDHNRDVLNVKKKNDIMMNEM